MTPSQGNPCAWELRQGSTRESYSFSLPWGRESTLSKHPELYHRPLPAYSIFQAGIWGALVESSVTIRGQVGFETSVAWSSHDECRLRMTQLLFFAKQANIPGTFACPTSSQGRMSLVYLESWVGPWEQETRRREPQMTRGPLRPAKPVFLSLLDFKLFPEQATPLPAALNRPPRQHRGFLSWRNSQEPHSPEALC